MYFYELHEGDGEILGDLLLAHDELFEPDEFFEMVQRIRRRVQDDFPHDTLIEAVAEGLENEYGFTTIDDDELAVSLFVSHVEEENEIVPTGTFAPEPEWGDDDDDDDDDDEEDDDEPTVELEDLPDFITITADLKKTSGPLQN